MTGDGGARSEPTIARALRLLGVLAFVATAFLPVHGCGPGPGPRPVGPRAPRVVSPAPEDVQVPVEEIVEGAERGFREGGPLAAFWEVRIWYPYLLAPPWLAALALALVGPRARRAAGTGLLTLCAAVAAFELIYVSYQFWGFLPSVLRPLEVGVAWIVVLAVLFLRRPGRSLLDPHATVSAMALLSILHAFTYPVSDARGWLRSGHDLGAVLRALLEDYRPAFWGAVAALAAAAAPGYLVRPRARGGVPAPDS